MAACRSTSPSRSSTTARAGTSQACLEAVLADLAGSGLEHRVLVLDNASGDDLSELARAHPEVAFETAERNLGFGAGHNRLATRHDAAALLILNPDARIVEPAHGRAAARGAARRRRGGGRAAADRRRRAPSTRATTGSCAASARASRRPRGTATTAAATSPPTPPGCPARRASSRGAGSTRVGGFDTGFFLYKEEEDLFLRIRQAGGRVLLPADGPRRARRRGVVAARDEHLAPSVARFAAQAHPLPRAAPADAGRAPRGGGLGRAARPPAGPLILLLHNRYRVPGGEERAVEDLAWLIRDRAGRGGDRARARLGVAERARARPPGLLRGRAAPGGGGGRRAAHRRARRARPQRPSGVRLARAGGGARRRRARRAAPAQLPARVRGRHVLHRTARTARAATAATRSRACG